MTNNRCSVRSRAGYLTLEVMIAVFMLAVIGIAIGKLVVDNSKSMVKVHSLDRSKTLADMAFEQYDAYASSGSFSSYDCVTVTPQAFFHAADNLGFDGYSLSTKANCSAGTLVCSVAVTILSPSGSSHVFSRPYNPRMAAGQGATVDVWVVNQPCNTADPESCSGMSGFQVSASSSAIPGYTNSMGTGQVIAYTMADGHAILHNVAILNGVVISARKPGSAVFASTNSFTQGYYVGYATAPASTDQQSLNVTQNGLNVAVFTNFQPLGTVQGTLVNSNGGSVSNMMVLLEATASTSLGLRFNNRWNVATDSDGNFVFKNVAPGLLTLWAAGDPGSHFQLTPADALFRWGYSNHVPYSVALPAPTNQSTPSSVNQSVSIHRLGWLRLQLQDPSGNPTNGYVHLRIPATLFRRETPVDLTLTSSPMSLFNLFDVDGASVSFVVTGNIQNYFATGYASNLSQTCNTNVENQVTINLAQGYTLSGVVVGSGSLVGVGGQHITGVSGTGSSLGQTMTNSTGTFSMPNYFPPLTYGGPGSTFLEYFQIGYAAGSSPPTTGIPVTFSGQFIDSITGEAIPNSFSIVYQHTLPFWEQAYFISSDANGNYAASLTADPSSTYEVLMTCDASNNCYPANSGHQIVVDPAAVTVPAYVIANSWTAPESYASVGPFHTGQNYNGVNLYYPVTNDTVAGYVTDANTGLPLSGIFVCDMTSIMINNPAPGAYPALGDINPELCALTGSGSIGSPAGLFELRATIQGRGRNADGSVAPGTVTIYVPYGQTAANGQAYAGSSSGEIPVSDPFNTHSGASYGGNNPDPSIFGEVQNITLTPVPGGI